MSHNLFAYCFNNPVSLSDSEGNWPSWAKKVVAAVAIVAAVTAIAAITVATAGAGTAVACAAMGAAQGAAVGLATGAVTGAASGAITHVLTTGSTDGMGDAMLNGMADGALSGAISGAVTGAFTSPYCFVAGTAVLTAAGTAAIETIEAGNLVWAWDEETGDVALKEVVETYVNETEELVHVFVNGEEIISTPSHPFYSPVKGWTDAVQLRAGDILVLVNGEYVVVEKVQHEILETPVTVYNFQVEDYHTYYVANGVLVHNSCGPNGTYQDAPYHRNGNAIKSPRPINGQAALDNSIQIKPTSPRRIGTSNNQIVVLDQTSPGLFHGHVRSWAELTETMKSTLIKAGLATPKGALK